MDPKAAPPATLRPVPGSVEEAILQSLKRLHQTLDEAEARLARPGERPVEAPVERRLYVGEPRAFSLPDDERLDP